LIASLVTALSDAIGLPSSVNFCSTFSIIGVLGFSDNFTSGFSYSLSIKGAMVTSFFSFFFLSSLGPLPSP